MLPSIVASELRTSITRFLRASFPMTTSGFRWPDGRTPVDALLDEPGRLFKGPYLTLGLPFRASSSDPDTLFEHVKMGFPPYHHQARAFERLTGVEPRSTLIATGTGSGKTESFLFPLLEDSAGRSSRGVKAIIIYPMNALAKDQARRIANEIHGTDTLRGRVSVGLFVGDQESEPSSAMGADSVITDHDVLRKNPPDILLTNYRMLDFLLMRPRDQALWQFNEPGVLRYLVVDELHTFDGAQGTDLACLIRRLRERLAPSTPLTCVGTSATIGDADAVDTLRHYAEQIFASTFDEDSVIMEERITPTEYLENEAAALPGGESEGEGPACRWPGSADLRRMRPEKFAAQEDYLREQARIWLGWAPALDAADDEEADAARVALGGALVMHPAFDELLRLSGRPIELERLTQDWAERFRLEGPEQAMLMVDSLLALVSGARRRVGGRLVPLVEVRMQLWLRELRRMVASVEAPPRLAFSDDLSHEEQTLHLPVAHCRECQATGWASVKRDEETVIEDDIQAVYRAWFGNHPDVCLMFPLDEEPSIQETQGLMASLCPTERRLMQGRGNKDGAGACENGPAVRVWHPDMRREVSRGGQKYQQSHHDCPFCGARDGLSLLGSRAASLASVLIGQMYNSVYNEHRKLIAFSDSVQDAAHRAGFFEARTYTTLVRLAIGGYIHKRGEDQDLATVAAEVPRHWRRVYGEDADFAATFIGPNMLWLRDYDALRENGALPDGSDLPELVESRLEWETIQGFGLRSRIGRTLERSRVAAVGVDVAGELERSAQALATRLSEEIGSLRGVSHEKVRTFLLGLLWRGRTRGAFYHRFLDEYIGSRGKTYKPFNLNPFLPNYGGASPPPALWTLGHVAPAFDNLHRESGSWYRGWFERVLATDAEVLASSEFRQVMSLTLEQLSRDGWLEAVEIGDDTVWGLRPQRWFCRRQVEPLVCGHCGHPIEVTDEEAEHWTGVPCLRNTCSGVYARGESERHVEEVSVAERPTRLVTAEHTALLESDERAAVEASFTRSDERPWDVNLLSATPTLEMGIDIGDLSSVLLCSVPPTQSNYLQRIGRAGRRDGNALAVTLANGVGHDNYFFEQPLEMLAGSIQPPGVFLNAAAVLERQLMAFLLDRWAASGIEEDAIPGRMRTVLDAIEREDPEAFPNNWLAFVEHHRRALFDSFMAMFPNAAEATRQTLEAFLFRDPSCGEHPGLDERLRNRLKDTAQRRKGWSQRIDRLKREIDRLNSEPEDEATREHLQGAHSEREALMSLRKHLNRQQTLNFLTDEGLIPNYAFPEEGVTLQSIILRRTRQQGEETGQRFERLNFKVQRSAEAALSELAPLNRFYAVGRAVEIDQIEIGSDSVEDWRFCDNCHYVENIELTNDRHSVCPRCGSAQWGDSAQKRSVLRMRQVFATADDQASRIGDDSEERQPVFYTRQMLVDIEPGQATAAWRMATEELPFAFEYVPRITLREINFGQATADDNGLQVAGDLKSRPGFQICRHCGKVRQTQGRVRSAALRHAYDCPLRRPGAEESDEDFYTSLYLFRELQSEAVRILLPLADFTDSDTQLHSLIAALNLGLREYFRGSVDHLRVTDYTAPGEGSRRRYLVLYDSVPGGTGYLKELLQDTGPLIQVLRHAYEVVHRCPCQDEEGKDGCYRCLLAWRDRSRMPHISRRSAEALLGKMLEHADQLEPIEGVEEVTLNSLIESELEQRFVEALLNASPNMQISPEIHEGKSGYFITTQPADGSAPQAWRLEYQVNLGPADGVRLRCKPDFVLWPVRASDGHHPVAIFVDGFSFHYNTVDDDTAKRQAILDSGRFRVWSLGWRDLPMTGKSVSSAAFDLIEGMERPGMKETFDAIAEKARYQRYGEYTGGVARGPFWWLIDYLERGEAGLEWFANAAFSRALAALDRQASSDDSLRQQAGEELATLAPEWAVEAVVGTEPHQQAVGGMLRCLERTDRPVRLAVGVPHEAMRNGVDALRSELSVVLAMDDEQARADEEFELVWLAFWGAANLFQFMARFTMSSAKGVANGVYAPPPEPKEAASDASEEQDDEQAWQELVSLSVFGERVLLLREAGIDCPEVGWEIRNDSGEVSLELELAWPARCIGLMPEEGVEEGVEALAREQGWRVYRGLNDSTIAELKV